MLRVVLDLGVTVVRDRHDPRLVEHAAVAQRLDDATDLRIDDVAKVRAAGLVGTLARDVRVEVGAGEIERQHVGRRPGLQVREQHVDRSGIERRVDLVRRAIAAVLVDHLLEEALERVDDRGALREQQAIRAAEQVVHRDPDQDVGVALAQPLVHGRRLGELVEIVIGVDRERRRRVVERHRRGACELALLADEVLVAGHAVDRGRHAGHRGDPRGHRRRRQRRQQRVIEVRVREVVAAEQLLEVAAARRRAACRRAGRATRRRARARGSAVRGAASSRRLGSVASAALDPSRRRPASRPCPRTTTRAQAATSETARSALMSDRRDQAESHDHGQRAADRDHRDARERGQRQRRRAAASRTPAAPGGVARRA